MPRLQLRAGSIHALHRRAAIGEGVTPPTSSPAADDHRRRPHDQESHERPRDSRRRRPPRPATRTGGSARPGERVRRLGAALRLRRPRASSCPPRSRRGSSSEITRLLDGHLRIGQGSRHAAAARHRVRGDRKRGSSRPRIIADSRRPQPTRRPARDPQGPRRRSRMSKGVEAGGRQPGHDTRPRSTARPAPNKATARPGSTQDRFMGRSSASRRPSGRSCS